MEKKKCPFRKQHQVTQTTMVGLTNIVPSCYEEEFLECIGEDCMAYYSWVGDHTGIKYDNCKLIEK